MSRTIRLTRPAFAVIAAALLTFGTAAARQKSDAPKKDNGADAKTFDRRGLAEPGSWADIPNEPITLDEFMVKYCQKRSKQVPRHRRQALVAGAGNGTVTIPPVAAPHRSGQAKRYFVRDLLRGWRAFLDEGVELPALLAGFPHAGRRRLPAPARTATMRPSWRARR